MYNAENIFTYFSAQYALGVIQKFKPSKKKQLAFLEECKRMRAEYDHVLGKKEVQQAAKLTGII